MLQSAEQGQATLVDYGGTVRFGSRITECSDPYCLDADKTKASGTFDWICLGTTLAQSVGVKIDNYTNASDLGQHVNSSGQIELVKKLIVSCLLSPSSSKIEGALSQLERL